MKSLILGTIVLMMAFPVFARTNSGDLPRLNKTIISYTHPLCKQNNVPDKECLSYILQWESAMNVQQFLEECKKTHSATYCMELLSKNENSAPANKDMVQEETGEDTYDVAI